MKKILHQLAFWTPVAGVALMLFVTLSPKAFSEYPGISANIFSYFTVQSNILVIIVTGLLMWKPNISGKFFKVLEFGALVNITVTGIVYAVILANIWNPTGLTFVYDLLLHYLAPIFFVLFWFFCRPKTILPWKIAFVWLIYPILYAIYTFVRGSIVNWYPYPFIDASKLELPQLLLNVGLMTVFFVIVSMVYVLISRGLSAKDNGRI